MKPHLILILTVLAASGCASSPSGGLPVCDGRRLRPANPNGSVLEPSAPASAVATPAKPAPAADQPGCGA